MDDLIAALPEWKREPCADGVVLHAPHDRVRLRVRPRLRAMPRLRAVLDQTIDEARTLIAAPADIEPAPLARWVTRDGEHAGLARAMLVAHTRTLEVAAAIIGDEPYGCIDAIGAGGTADLVRTFIERLGTGHGALRRRPYEYTPPSGWLGLRRHAATVWLHPRYPEQPSRITMFDARPFAAADAQRLDHVTGLSFPGELANIVEEPPQDLPTTWGLLGRSRAVSGKLGTGTLVHRCAAAATDDRFLYAGQFEGRAGTRDIATFLRVFASLHQVPARQIHQPRDWARE